MCRSSICPLHRSVTIKYLNGAEERRGEDDMEMDGAIERQRERKMRKARFKQPWAQREVLAIWFHLFQLSAYWFCFLLNPGFNSAHIVEVKKETKTWKKKPFTQIFCKFRLLQITSWFVKVTLQNNLNIFYLVMQRFTVTLMFTWARNVRMIWS